MDQAEELRYLFLAVQREGNRALTDALAPLDLTPAQAEVLQVLEQYGSLTLIELGERLVCENGQPQPPRQQHGRKGLVQKTVSQPDRRASQLTLSQRCARSAARAERHRGRQFNRSLDFLDEATMDQALGCSGSSPSTTQRAGAAAAQKRDVRRYNSAGHEQERTAMTQPANRQMRLEIPANLSAIYANAAIVSQTTSEIVLDFLQVMPNDPRARVQTRVVMTPTNAKLFLKALETNLARFEEKHGEILDADAARHAGGSTVRDDQAGRRAAQ